MMNSVTRTVRRPSRQWTVRVSYPENCRLSPSDRTMTSYAIHKVFADGIVDICTLRDLRRMLHPTGAAADAVDTQLRLIHCERFERLPPEVVAVVPDLIGAFLGVSVQPIDEDAQATTRAVLEHAADAVPA
jgi:hypothetical protein